MSLEFIPILAELHGNVSFGVAAAGAGIGGMIFVSKKAEVPDYGTGVRVAFGPIEQPKALQL